MLAERAMFTPAPALCALLVAGSWAGRAAAAAVASAWNSEISGGDDQSTSYNFLAIGDWGNDDAAQHEAAAGMGAVAAEIGATQVISLGDNFYHDDDSHCSTAGGHYGGICLNNTDGVDGVLRFNSTFESVYTAQSLRTIPWWAIAGNHDHAGNVTAQISYTTNAQNRRLPTGTGRPGLPAKRWNFPDYFFNVTQRVVIPGSGGKTVELEILLIDTCIMAGAPSDPATAAAQLEWLERRLASSTADYLWVGGHYPVWAIGQDPPTGVNPTLRPLLHRWEAHYFNGHEHDLEHIVEPGSKVNYVTTGAGHFCCYADKNLGTVPRGSIKFAMSGLGGSEFWGQRPPNFELFSGFTSYRISPASMRVYYHAHNGTLLYVTQPILPRTKRAQPPVPLCSNVTCAANWTRPPPVHPPGPPTPAGFPPSPPVPPAPTPAGMGWVCHPGMEAAGPAVAKLHDADHSSVPFGLESATVATCESACGKTAGCAVINWHDADRHCHTLTGPITPTAFEASLQRTSATGSFQACILVKQRPE